jgi:enoyl-CoA hydratase/carnithine racemase
MPDAVVTETIGHVLVITLNRPERRNAIDYAMAHSLEAVWDRLDGDDHLRAAVLTGAAGFFSAGADLKAAAEGAPPALTRRRGHFGTIQTPPVKPVLAAVEGDALGGGCELALACDLIIAAETARFGLPESRRGVLASGGGAIRLPNRIARNVAMEMALTGRPQSAVRLFSLGMVNQLCAPGGALAEALALANIISANAPLAVAAAKQVITAASHQGEAEAWALQEPILEKLRASTDYREGIGAFAEKRPPQWQGK